MGSFELVAHKYSEKQDTVLRKLLTKIADDAKKERSNDVLAKDLVAVKEQFNGLQKMEDELDMNSYGVAEDCRLWVIARKKRLELYEHFAK